MEEEFYENQSYNNINSPNQNSTDLDALQNILSILRPFDKAVISKLLKTISTYFELSSSHVLTSDFNYANFQPDQKFSENKDTSAKDFIFEKNPQTDVEKIACLAYYLTHYRNQEEFKTIDLSRLNTEAAQIKFSNPTIAVDHATRHSHFLVSTKKGYKKLSAIGELYVRALPDREEAKKVITKVRPKKRTKKNKTENLKKLENE